MKSCAYCGKEYPDSAVQCEVDGNELKAVRPTDFTNATGTGAQPRNPFILSATTAGIIFLYVSTNLLIGNANSPVPTWTAFLAVLSVLLACLVSVSLVMLWYRKKPASCQWLLVIMVTGLSYMLFFRLFKIAVLWVIYCADQVSK